MKVWLVFFAFATMIIVAAWWWLGRPVAIPAAASLAAGERLPCVSYAPFRNGQTPLDLSTRIPEWQIDNDLAQLAPLTACVRTYSVNLGLDRIAPIAQRHGLKVLQGLWLGPDPAFNRFQINTTIALANSYPEVIAGVVVGNEVLLRGEMSPAALVGVIREVKAAVPVPVTYADVWEFWLRNREVASAVDFVTIHILPYWEDMPIPASDAADHIVSITSRVAQSFAGKEIMVGEFGWPSAGRMRERALPSPFNQALVAQEVLARAKAQGLRVNLIEAFDQPWKRALEGTVGGHWGLLTAEARTPKFAWGKPVSNHPHWVWQALAGVVLAVGVFATAAMHREAPELPFPTLAGVFLNAVIPGLLVGWAMETIPLESFGAGGWVRSLALFAIVLLAPLAGTAAMLRGISLPPLATVLGRRDERAKDPFAFGLGFGLALLTVIALQIALGLVFDPRYRDFPFAPLTAAAVPFAVLAISNGSREARPRQAEGVAAIVLALSALFIVLNETTANWQAVWLGSILLMLAATLARLRVARSS
jgi:exo-beta-1,3-glucanase (GH17 family)